MKKKVGSLIIALFMALSALLPLASCNSTSGGDKQTESTQKANDGRYEIYVYDENNQTFYYQVIYVPEGNRLKVPEKRYGKVFLGFYSSDNICYFDERGNQAEGLIINKDLNLYLHYEYQLCTIRFDAGEGMFDDGEATEFEKYYGDTITERLPVPHLEGYTFVGWKNANGKLLTEGEYLLDGMTEVNDYYCIGENNTATLKAYYEVFAPRITLDYNDGTGKTEVRTVRYGGSLGELPTVDNGSTVLAGWATFPYASSNEIIDPYTTTFTEDTTLYAVYSEYKWITLVYTRSNSKRERVYKDSNRFTLPVGEETTNENPGYTIIKWYTDPSFTGGTSAAYAYFNDGVDTFYADWELAVYKIEFRNEDGTKYEGGAYDREYTYEDAFKLPTTTRAHYEYLGWCRRADLSDEPIKKIEAGTYGSMTLFLKAEHDGAIIINTASDLKKIRDNPRGKYYLEKNINLGGEDWIPIEEFSGVLYGNGKKIYNFNLPVGKGGFIITNSGTIKDLTISDFSLSCDSGTIGVLAAENTGNGVIERCTVEDGVIGFSSEEEGNFEYRIGGIVGDNSGKILDSVYKNITCNVTKNMAKGYIGICNYLSVVWFGGVSGVNRSTGVITGCTANVSLTSVTKTKGGLEWSWGHADWYTIVQVKSYLAGCCGRNEGTIKEVKVTFDYSSSGSHENYGTSVNYAGGIAAANAGTIDSCSVVSVIKGNGEIQTYFGGLLGCNEGADSQIQNCISQVTITNEKGIGVVAGLVGDNEGKISNCYTTGTIKTSNKSNSGCLVGHNFSTASIVKCFCICDIRSNSTENLGILVGLNDGIVRKCYYNLEAQVLVNNKKVTLKEEYALSDKKTAFYQKTMIYDELTFDETVWSVNGSTLPTLKVFQ